MASGAGAEARPRRQNAAAGSEDKQGSDVQTSDWTLVEKDERGASALEVRDLDGCSWRFAVDAGKLLRSPAASKAGHAGLRIEQLISTAASSKRDSDVVAIVYDQEGVGCEYSKAKLTMLRRLADDAGVTHNLAKSTASSPSATVGVVSREDMATVAAEVVRLEQQCRRMRFGGMVSLVFLLASSVGFGRFKFLAWQEATGRAALASPKPSVANPGGDAHPGGVRLVDQGNTGFLPLDKLPMIRTVSWWEGDTLRVHHVAHVTRHSREKGHIEVVTQAGHEMMIWDSAADVFNIMMRKYDHELQRFGPWEEVLTDGDKDVFGRGRVVVSLRSPPEDDADAADSDNENEFY
eukprot:TRINITY_DN38873_c0_g1_i1.p1 TRINITY_DN38873_c0_g1~~TRINITY_DN38873_c0_g1_i1.p1  ORF type:complete len:374 (+),score=69.88 TRINITY_DN38873_c0_g1_i1:74-1123(+)